MRNKGHSYSAEEIDVHFRDSIIPSSSKTHLRTTSPATFNVWNIESDPATLIDIDETNASPANSILSRLTIFAYAAQPLYPPYVYTRSEHTILSKNVGRVIPIFRQIPQSRRKFIWDGYVRVVAMEIIPAKSDDLKAFITRKIAQGGLQNERTKEQWEETFGADWCRVTLAFVNPEIGDPMDLTNIRSVIDALVDTG
jgi:hypothetical protein